VSRIEHYMGHEIHRVSVEGSIRKVYRIYLGKRWLGTQESKSEARAYIRGLPKQETKPCA
jgi:hypothetical protein